MPVSKADGSQATDLQLDALIAAGVDLCQELGITRQTLYRHLSPKGELRPDGEKLLGHNG